MPAVDAAAMRLLTWFGEHGRRLPWRTERSPYRVVVSEFMLAQTQVARVVPIFDRFVARFPSFAELAAAQRADVVRAWQGLGYNSRAVRLHALARAVCEQHGGALPSDLDALLALPGVGRYTAGAIRAFAFDIDDVAADVNVRRVVQRTFFGVEWQHAAAAGEVDAVAAQLVAAGGGNAINSALMDVGATLCRARAAKCLLCPLVRQCASAPIDAAQLAAAARAGVRTRERFEDSTRYLRGRIVDALRGVAGNYALSIGELYGRVSALAPGRSIEDVGNVATALARDGVVAFDGERIALGHDGLPSGRAPGGRGRRRT